MGANPQGRFDTGCVGKPRRASAILLLFIAAVLFFRPGSLSASGPARLTPLKLDASLTGRNPTPLMEVLEDPEDAFKIQDVCCSELSDRFKKTGRDRLTFGYTKSTYWLRMALYLPPDQSSESGYLLEAGYPALDLVELYSPLPGGRWKVQQAGDSLQLSVRDYQTTKFLFNLDIAPGQTNTYYLKVRSKGTMRIPLAIWPEEAYLVYSNKVQYAVGIFFGVILAMITYNLFLYASIGDKAYLYYILYLTGFGLYFSCTSGHGQLYLWPGLPWLSNHMGPFNQSLMVVGGSLFTIAFLDTRRLTPYCHKMFRILIVLGLVIMVLTLSPVTETKYYGSIILVDTVLGLLSCLAALGTGFLHLVKGARIARFYFAAWLAFLVLGALHMMMTLNLVPSNFLSRNGMTIGVLAQVFLLSFALADKIKLLRLEKLEVQRQLTEELEIKVIERTGELEAAYKELKSLSNQDGLTKLYNRRYLEGQLEQEWRRMRREGRPLAAIMIDVDHFKLYNDTYGHQAGDSCLRALAKVFKAHAQRAGDYAARYGGEEFLILLAGLDLEKAMSAALSIKKGVDDLRLPHESSPTRPYVTISQGAAAIYPGEGASPSDLLTLADEALYRSKETGRDRVTPADPADLQSSRESMQPD